MTTLTAVSVVDVKRRLDAMPPFAEAPNNGWEEATRGRNVADRPSLMAWAIGRFIQGAFGDNPISCKDPYFQVAALNALGATLRLYNLCDDSNIDKPVAEAVAILTKGWKYGSEFGQWYQGYVS